MQGVFDACKLAILGTSKACVASKVYQEESLKLGRFVGKAALVLSELELQLHADDSLRGSQEVFLVAEAFCGAFQGAESLMRQVGQTGAARIWPLEDAVEFQSVALELYNAVSRLDDSNIPLPDDVVEDVRHVRAHLKALTFTEEELEESEAAELQQVQRRFGRPTSPPPPPPSSPQEKSNIMPLSKVLKSRSTTTAPPAPAQKQPSGGSGGWDQEPLEGALDAIPPPDEGITRALDEAGQVYVNLDEPFTTALPPGFPVKGAVPAGSVGLRDLPGDPFSMAGGAGNGGSGKQSSNGGAEE